MSQSIDSIRKYADSICRNAWKRCSVAMMFWMNNRSTIILIRWPKRPQFIVDLSNHCIYYWIWAAARRWLEPYKSPKNASRAVALRPNANDIYISLDFIFFLQNDHLQLCFQRGVIILDAEFLPMSRAYHWLAVHSVCDCFTSCSVNTTVRMHNADVSRTANYSNVLNLNFVFPFSDLMQCFSVAYQNKVLSVPLEWLTKVMAFESWQQLVTDLKYYGMVPDTQQKSIRFQRDDSFFTSKPIVIIR